MKNVSLISFFCFPQEVEWF